MLEIFDAGILVNDKELKPGDLGEVAQVPGGHGIAEAGVVRPAGIDPGRGGDLQVGARQPQGVRHRQFGQRRVGRDNIHHVRHQAEAIAQFDQRSADRGTGVGIEDQAQRVSLAANGQRQDLQPGLLEAMDSQTSSMCAPSTLFPLALK